MAKRRRRPPKPSVPVGQIVFSSGEPPRRVIERPPADPEDLERAIVRKFIGALRHAHHRELVTPRRGDRWPDFETREGPQKVGIEVVEIVNDEHARLRGLQARYAGRVARLLDDVSARLTGLAITLEDGYQMPPYPPLRSGAGEQLSREIADRLRDVMPTLEALNVGEVYFNRWQGPPRPTIAAIVRRLAPGDAGIPVAIGFPGVFPETIAAAQTRLARQIFSKVQRHYQAYHGGTLWLLAYQVADVPAGPRDFAFAKEVLQRREHPFGGVWYIYPLAEVDLGAIQRIWP